MIEVVLKQAEIDPIHKACRCWRCRAGGVAKSDMPQLDRILARHLLRMGNGEQLSWLREWELNPNHGSRGRSALERWLEIEQGRRIAEPIYHVRISV